MTSYSVELDLVSALATPQDCPGCGCSELTPQSDQGVVTFVCASCARVWYAGAGAMVTLHRFPLMRPEPPGQQIPRQARA